MVLETIKTTKCAARLLLLFSLLCGVLYPLLVTGIATFLFPGKAGGSLILKNDAVLGSELIGQKFTLPKYFHGRPSAGDYATIPSGASNQSPTSQTLREAVQGRQVTYGALTPTDLLTTSASGLDPHITPQSAYIQIERIVAERGLDPVAAENIRSMVARNTELPTFGFLGKDRVNVLKLNIELDQELP